MKNVNNVQTAKVQPQGVALFIYLFIYLFTYSLFKVDKKHTVKSFFYNEIAML